MTFCVNILNLTQVITNELPSVEKPLPECLSN